MRVDESTVRKMRIAALIEGASFLVLLFFAMPLKYIFGMPEFVRWVGWAHGLLFMVFCALLAIVFFGLRWPFWRGVLVFAAAWIPFGPFLIDRRMRGYEQEAATRRALK